MAKRQSNSKPNSFILSFLSCVKNQRGSAVVLVALISAAMISLSFKNGHFGKPFAITFYWLIEEKTEFPDEPWIEVLDINSKHIAWAPEWLVKEIAMEGSGYLPHGQLVNLACACAYPDSRFFVVDQIKNPWGLDASANPLVPFKSIAVDPNIIPLGSKVFVPAFKDLQLPDGSKHNGCFFANDTGYGIKGRHLDIFSGTFSNYHFLIEKLKNSNSMKAFDGGKNCE